MKILIGIIFIIYLILTTILGLSIIGWFLLAIADDDWWNFGSKLLDKL